MQFTLLPIAEATESAPSDEIGKVLKLLQHLAPNSGDVTANALHPEPITI